MRKILLVLAAVAVLGLTGCIQHQIYHLDVAYMPVGSAGKVAGLYPVSVSVEDNRPVILSGKQQPYFMGIQRSTFGESGYVLTEGEMPLANQIKRDLTADLVDAGFTVTDQGAERSLRVSIEDYNFDCYNSCRVWHKLAVQVKDSSGKLLSSKQVVAEQVVPFKMGFQNLNRIPYDNIKDALPAIYANMIRNIVRNDAGTLAALTRQDALAAAK